MKASQARTYWIILASITITGYTCFKSIIKAALSLINRPWVDKTLNQFANNLLNLVGVTCKVVNPHKIKPLPGQPTIIMCNHSSLYDIPLSLKAFPNASVRMLAKLELSKIPIMGKGMRAAEFVFIDRKNKQQVIKDLAKVHELLISGIIMWIAPEGTRSADGKLAAFKKGGFITAIKAKATIIPIGIRGANKILPAKSKQFNLNQAVEIHIGEPIDASQFTLETKEKLMAITHQSIKELADA